MKAESIGKKGTPLRQSRNRTGFRAGVYLFTLIVLVYIIVFMGTPYVVYQPEAPPKLPP